MSHIDLMSWFGKTDSLMTSALLKDLKNNSPTQHSKCTSNLLTKLWYNATICYLIAQLKFQFFLARGALLKPYGKHHSLQYVSGAIMRFAGVILTVSQEQWVRTVCDIWNFFTLLNIFLGVSLTAAVRWGGGGNLPLPLSNTDTDHMQFYLKSYTWY